MREENKFYKVIGKKDGEIYILDYTFKDGGFMGATGTVITLLTEDELETRINEYDWEEIRKIAVENNNTKDGLDERVENMSDGEKEGMVLDVSYSNEEWMDEIKEHFSEEDGVDYTYSDCVGGGRCFYDYMINPERWDKLYNPELLEIIKEIEGF